MMPITSAPAGDTGNGSVVETEALPPSNASTNAHSSSEPRAPDGGAAAVAGSRRGSELGVFATYFTENRPPTLSRGWRSTPRAAVVYVRRLATAISAGSPRCAPSSVAGRWRFTSMAGGAGRPAQFRQRSAVAFCGGDGQGQSYLCFQCLCHLVGHFLGYRSVAWSALATFKHPVLGMRPVASHRPVLAVGRAGCRYRYHWQARTAVITSKCAFHRASALEQTCHHNPAPGGNVLRTLSSALAPSIRYV